MGFVWDLNHKSDGETNGHAVPGQFLHVFSQRSSGDQSQVPIGDQIHTICLSNKNSSDIALIDQYGRAPMAAAVRMEGDG